MYKYLSTISFSYCQKIVIFFFFLKNSDCCFLVISNFFIIHPRYTRKNHMHYYTNTAECSTPNRPLNDFSFFQSNKPNHGVVKCKIIKLSICLINKKCPKKKNPTGPQEFLFDFLKKNLNDLKIVKKL